MSSARSQKNLIRSSRGVAVVMRGARGFTIVELMVVVTIIALLAALALPAARRAGMSAKASAVANDLRVFATAFGTYTQQAGSYPPEAAVGVMPPLMVGSTLGQTSWLRKTPIGGNYNWDNAQAHAGITPRAAIAINSNGSNLVTTDRTQLLMIDRRIDDGNLATGNFFLGAHNEPVFIVER
jgi:prepilin-type N-terminal cleavage/methylation domain-containing protein